MLLKEFIGGRDQIFKIISWLWFRTQCHNCRQWEADHWCRTHCHCFYAQIQLEDHEDSKAEEHLFHSQMWVKGTPLHFVVDNGSQKNLISAEFIKRLDLSTTPHLQPYNIYWLSQGQGIFITHQSLLPYVIKPFKDEVLCDVAPLEVCDVLLGQPYMWKCHVP